jgi:hypothetical protein
MAPRSKLFTEFPKDRVVQARVKARLEACLALDLLHILPGAKGDEVSVIQAALIRILPGLRLPKNLIAESEIIDQGDHGPCGRNSYDTLLHKVPNAGATKTDPDPKFSACTPFFALRGRLAARYPYARILSSCDRGRLGPD